jgi:hypothetical protein
MSMGATMPFSKHNIDPEYIEAMRAAFHRVCDALQLNSHADDPMTEIVVTKLHLPDSSEQRGGQDGRLDAAERGAQVLGIRRRLQVNELMGVADGGAGARDGRRAGSSIGLMGEERRDRGRAGGGSMSTPMRATFRLTTRGALSRHHWLFGRDDVRSGAQSVLSEQLHRARLRSLLAGFLGESHAGTGGQAGKAAARPPVRSGRY